MKVTDAQIIAAASIATTMSDAARALGLHLSAFAHRAKRLGVYVANQGRRGAPRDPNESAAVTIPLQEILDGKHPGYGTNRLKKRLIREGVLQDRCSTCGDESDEYSRILDHIDGNNSNHTLDNLRLLCPNCNAKLPTHAGRNKRKHTTPMGVDFDTTIADDVLQGLSNRDILLKHSLTPNGANYRRVDRVRIVVEHVVKLNHTS